MKEEQGEKEEEGKMKSSNPNLEINTQSLPDKMCYVASEHVSIKAARTALDRLQESLADDNNLKHKRALDHMQTLLKRIEERQDEHEKAHYELMRQYTEIIKQRSIQAPPDQPPLQTIPYSVGQPTTTIHNKSELTKRTLSSTATIQKKNETHKK